MLSVTQLQELHKQKIENAKVSKPSLANKLKADADAFLSYAQLIKNNNWGVGNFERQKREIESKILARKENFINLLEYNSQQAKEYHQESGLMNLEHSLETINTLLEC